MEEYRAAYKERIRAAEERWIREQAEKRAEQESYVEQGPIDPLMTTEEAAKIRGVHSNAIREAIKRGTLEAVSLHPPGSPPQRRNYRIYRSALDRWMSKAPNRPKFADCSYAVERHRADGYMTIKEAATMIGVSRSRINALCTRRNNPLPRVQLDKVWFLHRRDVISFLDQRTLQSLKSLGGS